MPQIIFFRPPERIVIPTLLLFLCDVLMFLISALLTEHQSEQIKKGKLTSDFNKKLFQGCTDQGFSDSEQEGK